VAMQMVPTGPAVLMAGLAVVPALPRREIQGRTR
jgi:hypothetical protein